MAAKGTIIMGDRVINVEACEELFALLGLINTITAMEQEIKSRAEQQRIELFDPHLITPEEIEGALSLLD